MPRTSSGAITPSSPSSVRAVPDRMAFRRRTPLAGPVHGGRMPSLLPGLSRLAREANGAPVSSAGTGLVTADGELWRTQRLLMTPTLRVEVLDDIIGIAKRAVVR